MTSRRTAKTSPQIAQEGFTHTDTPERYSSSSVTILDGITYDSRPTGVELDALLQGQSELPPQTYAIGSPERNALVLVNHSQISRALPGEPTLVTPENRAELKRLTEIWYAKGQAAMGGIHDEYPVFAWYEDSEYQIEPQRISGMRTCSLRTREIPVTDHDASAIDTDYAGPEESDEVEIENGYYDHSGKNSVWFGKDLPAEFDCSEDAASVGAWFEKAELTGPERLVMQWIADYGHYGSSTDRVATALAWSQKTVRNRFSAATRKLRAVIPEPTLSARQTLDYWKGLGRDRTNLPIISTITVPHTGKWLYDERYGTRIRDDGSCAATVAEYELATGRVVRLGRLPAVGTQIA